MTHLGCVLILITKFFVRFYITVKINIYLIFTWPDSVESLKVLKQLWNF